MMAATERAAPDGPSICDSPRFDEIIGNGPALREVLSQIDIVARTDCTVLILGETGTGKELVARAIHSRSARAREPFVKLNCAAIPGGLLESELFGHERGAFTGALARRTGRFELADHGTIFLDEVGEMPLDVQPKLLRMLQEREFERLGSSQTLRSNARLVAATNRDLAEMCGARVFRQDLYFRLNVFPIRLPALRERRDDIPVLAHHFTRYFAARVDKDIRHISDAAMSALVAHDWPGNVRELQNVLERSVLLASGPVLEIAMTPSSEPAGCRHPHGERGDRLYARVETLEDVARAHILAVLESTRGVIAGPNGAAARLGLKRTTLISRMKKLGISRGIVVQVES